MKTLLKNHILIPAILSFFLLGAGGCNNDDDAFVPTLPPITQTGENTFGCYVDGKLLIPRDGTGSLHTTDSGLRFIAGPGPTDFTYNEIMVRDFKSGNGGLLTLHITDLQQNGEGTYTINESNCKANVDANPNINLFVRWWNEEAQAFKWYCSIENGGTLTITRYDFENRIVSGTFNSTAVNRDDPNDFIEITEGRFDIKWNELPGNFP
ncbi:MAG: hypothetical protein GX163_02215 [Bacteroidetes bacterium]|jgi:hypothetical protein|nr:hypothetical protein [Bacteroidota bacterium]